MGKANKRTGGRTSGAGTQSPKAKKAKVDPVAEQCQSLVKFFEETAELPDRIASVLTGSIAPALSQLKGERHPLEHFYATTIGEALRSCVQTIDQEVALTAAGLAGAEQAEAQAAVHAEQSVDALAAASQAVAAAKAAEAEVKEQADKADDDKDVTQKQAAEHDNAKAKFEGEETELRDALAIVAGPELSTKEAKKFAKLLEAVGCSAACISAVPAALGKTGGFEGLVLAEAGKALAGKHGTVAQQLQDWDKDGAALTQKLAETDARIVALAESLAAREAELQGAKAAEKAAKAGKKEAENARGSAKKEVGNKQRQASGAQDKKAAAAEAAATYRALLDRAPAPEPAEDDAAPEDVPME